MKKFLVVVAIVVLLPCSFLALPSKASADCTNYDSSTDLSTCSHAQLQTMLAQINAESAETQAELTAQKNKSSSIASDVALLNSLIAKAAQQIQIKNQIIAQLGTQITQKNQTIQTLSDNLNSEYESLGQIIRKKNEIDNMTLTELLLSDDRISDFFQDVDNLHTINQALQASVDTITGNRNETTAEKTDLQQQQEAQAALKLQIQQQQAQTQAQQSDKEALLASSKSQEKTYAQLLAQRQAQAAKISAALFQLAGGSKAIPFGDAYNYAKVASAKTGVRPAFILAILKQESNLGTDQGGCYVTDLDTGAGTRASTGAPIATVMKAPRDTVPFEKILTALGYSLSATQVSCPEKVDGAYMGYGGAMGPTQFIPSTWIQISDRIAAALGESSANPWDPQDAVMATGIFMSDLGASDPAQERTAACKYYSGHGCTGYATSYGNSVIKLESSIQSDIDVIDGASQ